MRYGRAVLALALRTTGAGGRAQVSPLPLMFNIVGVRTSTRLKDRPIDGFGIAYHSNGTRLRSRAGGLTHRCVWLADDLLGAGALFGVSLVLGAVSITQTSALVKARFALLGYLLLAVCFVCFILAIERLSEGVSLLTLGLFAVSLLTLWGFVVLSRRKEPLIHLSVFANRTFLLSVGYILIVQFVVLALGYLIPNYSQLVRAIVPA